MKSPAIVILGENSIQIARQVQSALPEAVIYGLSSRTQTADVTYDNFGELVRYLFQEGTPVIGVCAAGILIRTIAPLLQNKWEEPPLLAIAEDGSAVVPLLGGITGVNELARQISSVLQVTPAITTTGEIRFRTTLLSPPPGYRLINPDDAKGFIADLLAGNSVKLIGEAHWLSNSQLPFSSDGKLTIGVIPLSPLTPLTKGGSRGDSLTKGGSRGDSLTKGGSRGDITPSPTCLVYEVEENELKLGKLTIVGTGPGGQEWLSPQVRQALLLATDWVGYKTYLDLVEYLRKPHINRHESDNRVELERATMALNLASEGKSVVLISSGDPGIYAMAAAVFEVLDTKPQPQWSKVEIKVCPGISAMQAAAASVGAPLGHDFCVISLSNILKPWDVIARRINLAAEADLAIAFYNPISKDRTWQLAEAKEILLQWRKPETPIVLARNLGRPGQQVQVKSLIDLAIDDADMRTVILIGSSQTLIIKQGKQIQWLYTPRHYVSKL